MFDYYSNSLNFTNIGGSDSVTNQLSYMVDLGGGYKFGLGIESPGDRATDNISDYFSTRRPLQAAYSEGGLSYLGAIGIPTTLGQVSLAQSDGVVIQGEMKLMRGHALTAAFQHNWTPTKGPCDERF